MRYIFISEEKKRECVSFKWESDYFGSLREVEPGN